jgi:acetyl-CoA carboxylase biotin carboxyl carrier protein
MKTDLNYIKKLIKLLESGNVNEIEIDEEGTKIRLIKNKPSENPQYISYIPPQMQNNQASSDVSGQSSAKAEEKSEIKAPVKENLVEVRSPIVGTFYRAPSPNADPYVQVGQDISTGTVLCIIEAMKLMNEIESEVSGKVVKIMAENAQPVEYNQVLFLVEPN